MKHTYQVEHIAELDLETEVQQQIAALVQQVFPESEYQGRFYFKQLAHSRLLVSDDGKVVAHAGLDYRLMRMNETPVKVLGIIDLAVAPDYQGRGLGGLILKKAEEIARNSALGVDFLFLVADIHDYYRKFGFELAVTQVQWLTIDQHQNHGVLDKYFDDCLMYKQVGALNWQNGNLDMLGYWY